MTDKQKLMVEVAKAWREHHGAASSVNQGRVDNFLAVLEGESTATAVAFTLLDSAIHRALEDAARHYSGRQP